ncbi:metallophosphoesterase [Planctomicrobium sp. SH664]|uniref:metallophosphoesterase n=1 Tax=Planctomicrobium sp. SH664 TaxID=3448125 RepID=UPI003F5B96FB
MLQFDRRQFLKTGMALTIGGGLPLTLWKPLAAAPADPYAEAVFVDGEPPPIAHGASTIVVLPDTQKYEKFPEGFLSQTDWIARNAKDRNIACVLHLGDITDNNRKEQWELAVKAMGTLDGKVPYFFVNGNHDYSEDGNCVDRTTQLNTYFPVSKFSGLPTFGGVYDKEPDRMENSYHLFSAGGRDYLVLALEFGPRKDVVRWANEVVARYPQRGVILITHAYMFHDDTRYGWERYGTKQRWNPHSYGVAKASGDDVCDGDELWDQLLSKHENFLFTLNGHVLGDGLGRLSSVTPGGRAVEQMLVNFQHLPSGGDGWLRLIEISPDGKQAKVLDYSPTRQQRNESAQNKFEFELAPVGGKS